MATSPILRANPAALRRRLEIRAKQTSLTLFPQAARHGESEPPSGASAPPPDATRSEKPAMELVGIARLAAASPRAEAKRGTEYFLLPVKSILNECHSERVPFRWTVNPYRGCEFGCKYCYARYTHEYMDVDGGEFETKIYVKQDGGQLAEREFGTTRAILERMAEREGLSLSITTKSNQVLRDVELLRRIAAKSALSITLSVTTVKTRLARMLEPRAPRPDLRLEAVRKLREAGLDAGVLAMPVLPGITDGEEDLEALARAVSESGAQWFAANVLFLMPASLKQFLPFLKEKFPRLVKRYGAWYGRYGNAPEEYRQEIAGRIEKLRRKYGLGSRPDRSGVRAWQSPQMQLGFAKGG